MPCVGGYVDKAMPTDTGWINKLNGGDVHYGNKAVGVISLPVLALRKFPNTLTARHTVF